ncbi:uncharacterized protein LOC143298234 [Babylonia areolata]|uniref:uncharacterized protein LOC143298234 n=1 Tax=Babylonia areolata TaxID=304850 RepID=UPI003FD69B83
MVLVKSRSGGSGGGGVVEGRVCSVAWQRQHVHHQQTSTRAGIRMAAQGGEALPVVELRPFTKRVWRREKSLPNLADQPDVKGDTATDTSSRNGGILPPPNIGHFIRELREQRRVKDAPRVTADRLRLKLHPKADFSFDGDTLAEHRQDLIPSFVSRQDRSKSSLGEDGGAAGTGPVGAGSNAGGGGGVVGGGGGGGGGGGEDAADNRPGAQDPAGGVLVRESSNLMTAYTRDKPLHHQSMCLMGDKIPVGLPGRRHLAYLNPFPGHRQRQAWNVMRLENSPTGVSPRQKVNISFVARDGRPFPVNARDHLPPSQDLVLSGSLLHSTGVRPHQPPSRQRQTSPHKFNQKLGAARDSFLVLNKTGAPTVVEQNLSFDHEVRLDRCRRERSFAALSYISEMTAMAPAHFLSCDSQPTPGEAVLMKAREANRPHDRRPSVPRRKGLDRSLVTLPAFTRHHTFFQGRAMDLSPTSNQSEHGDSDVMSSPGTPVDASSRLVDPMGPALQTLAPTIQRLPLHSDVHRTTYRDSHKAAAARDSVPLPAADNLALLQADVVSLVDSTDEYHRPLSDTAATETVHVRNDQTPMSADNRARLLPRYDAYLEVIQTDREHAPPCVDSHAENGVLFQDNDPLRAAQGDSGAEAANTETDDSHSNSLNHHPASLSLTGGPGPLKSEGEGSEAHPRMKDSSGRNVSTSDPTRSVKADVAHSVKLDSDVTAAEKQQCEPAQQQVNCHVSPAARHSERNHHQTQLPDGSTATTLKDTDKRESTEERGPKSDSVIREGHTPESKGSGMDLDDSHKEPASNRLSVCNSVASKPTSKIIENQQDTAAQHPGVAGDDTAQQEGVPNGHLTANVTADSKVVLHMPFIDGNQTAESQHNENRTNQANTSMTELSSINTSIENIFSSDQTAAGKTPQKENDAKGDSEAVVGGTSSADSSRALARSGTNQSSNEHTPIDRERKPIERTITDTEQTPTDSEHKPDKHTPIGSERKPTGNEHAPTPSSNPETGTSGRGNEDGERDVQSAVDTTATVSTVDNAQCGDNYDASKTFLTTANVESEDWQDIMAV